MRCVCCVKDICSLGDSQPLLWQLGYHFGKQGLDYYCNNIKSSSNKKPLVLKSDRSTWRIQQEAGLCVEISLGEGVTELGGWDWVDLRNGPGMLMLLIMS